MEVEVTLEHGVDEPPNRCQTHDTKELGRSSQPLRSLTQAPVFSPTEEEFADALGYIKSISPAIYRYGIVKVIPPPSFSKKSGIDIENNPAYFNTKLQELSRLTHKNITLERFKRALKDSVVASRISGEDDWIKLRQILEVVNRLGGYENVLVFLT